jgi:hypothetical protein
VPHARVAIPDMSASKEHPTDLAIREKPKSRRVMDLPLRTMAQTSGIAKKVPDKDAPSRPALAERIERGLAAVTGSGDNSNAVISEHNPKLALDHPSRKGIVVTRLTYRRTTVVPRISPESFYEESPAMTALRIDPDEETYRSMVQGKEVSIDRNCYILLQIHRETPKEPTVASSATAADDVSCMDYQEANRRKHGDGSRVSLRPITGDSFTVATADSSSPVLATSVSGASNGSTSARSAPRDHTSHTNAGRRLTRGAWERWMKRSEDSGTTHLFTRDASTGRETGVGSMEWQAGVRCGSWLLCVKKRVPTIRQGEEGTWCSEVMA